MQNPLSNRRQTLRQVAGCCLVGAAAWGSLWPASLRAQTPARSRQHDAWAEAQPPIRKSREMARRITSSLEGLMGVASTALNARSRLETRLRELADSIAELTRERDRLLEEYRSGLFCSGCGRTKSQILAKGDRFPHPGQSIVRPTPEQIAAKERELQAPIDRDTREAASKRQDLDETKVKASAALDQIGAGLDLWRTAVTYWSGSVGRGLRDRRGELEEAVAQFKAELETEQRRVAAASALIAAAAASGPVAASPASPPPTPPRSDIALWQRLLDEQLAEVQRFQVSAQSSTQELARQRREQQSRLLTLLARSPMNTAMMGRTAVDVPISPLTSPHELGVRYLLGTLPKLPSAADLSPAAELRPEVVAFVSEFKASGLPIAPGPSHEATANAGLPGVASAGPVPPPAAPAPARNPLLQALP